MSSTEDRIRQLVEENLEVDGQPIAQPINLDSNLSDAGVSSMDVVAFGKLVNEEFNANLSVEDCAKLPTLRALIDHLDA
ncbi:MAG: acyl carrier protein [Chloroflexi bacterium]|nr:acyl carrier protein [Chloroflexota bacterium]MCY3939127.1 acyl carrier protein [Chloroflexota bacterium]MCY4108625.1 acyl carrier protein [Chloroflexota bacterium]